MARVNVYSYGNPDDYDYEGPTLAGWFDPASADSYEEATHWDGHNNVSVNPVGRHGHQQLHRTKGGRWVLNTWSQWQGSEDRYEFIGDDQAREWLIRNEEDQAVARWFSPLAEESGPNLGGRPKVGDKVEVRLTPDLIAAIDERAATEGVGSRAEMLRRLIVSALN